MSQFTQKLSTPLIFALFLSVIFTATNTVTAVDDQVPWIATGTAVLTKLTKLPGGLTQLDFNVTGNAPSW